MANYFDELKESKNFVGNVVIRFLGEYFTLRAPDSGLTVDPRYSGLVASLVLNGTTIDPRRVSTTIASYSSKLVDKNLAITQLVKEKGQDLIRQPVEIWLGRVGVAMDFSEYYKLPITRIKKISRQDNGYTFSSTEETDRLNRPIYDATTRLSGLINPATSVINGKEEIDDFPPAGFLKIGREFLSYSSKSNATKTFSGITRGNFNTTPAVHEENDSVFLAEQITDNPINILLKILMSGGGGGVYDVLADGLGIDQNLVDIAELEGIRNDLFSGVVFTLSLANIVNALKFLEDEILSPCNLRFTYSRASKFSLAVLDKARFVDAPDAIDEDSLTQFPKWEVNDNNIVNEISVEWGYSEDTEKYLEKNTFQDLSSISSYEKRSPLNFKFKGPRASNGGLEFISDFAGALLRRLSTPTPEISVNTHIDKSLLNVGDKTILESGMIPSDNGTLQFAQELEIVSRSINYQTGDVSQKLAYTSFTGIRSCYIAPSDTIASVVSQSVVTFGAGRGDLWAAGFKVRLWDNATFQYLSDPVNEILSITGDQITFTNPWSTTLLTSHRIKFADYDDCSKEQKRYCFISIDGQNFPDGAKQYSITP
jgi:hypothetical protein